MGETLLLQPEEEGGTPVSVLLRRSGRARRMSLRVSSLDGRVTLSLPAGTRIGAAEAFLHQQAGWLRRHLARHPAARVPGAGDLFPVEGMPLALKPRPGLRRCERAGDLLLVPDDAAAVLGALRAYLMTLARARLVAASDRAAAALGCRYSAIALRDTRSRWGSCSSRGRLMFSWRLSMAPPAVLNYVAVHEVAHLREMNHGPGFWALVNKLDPDCDASRRWLRENGALLHRWRFELTG